MSKLKSSRKKETSSEERQNQLEQKIYLGRIKVKTSTFILIILIAVGTSVMAFGQNTDFQEFASDNKSKYVTKDHPKAKGINISVEYPSHWKAAEAGGPNIVHKFIGDKSDGITRMFTILIKDTPDVAILEEAFAKGTISENDLKEFVPAGGSFINARRSKYDDQPGARIMYSEIKENAGIKLKMFFLLHMFFYGGKGINIHCAVSGPEKFNADLSQEFNYYIPLFQQIGNSVIIQDKLDEATSPAESKKDYRVEDVSGTGMILNKKIISTKYNISILFPSSWDVVRNITDQYSVVTIRSEHGSGLENLNINVIPLDNEKEYSIKDIEDAGVPEVMTLLGSGRIQIGSKQALWKKTHMETSGIMSNKQMKEMLSKPLFRYRKIERHAVLYQVQVVRNNHIYTISCTALDSTKKLALKRLDEYEDLYTEMVQSFNFEKERYYSSEHKLTIDIPDGWSRFSPRPGILANYGKRGSGENFMIRVKSVPASTRVEKLTWQELFYPQYTSLYLEEDDSLVDNDKTFKYCVYKIADKRLKKQQERENDLKYMEVAFMNGSELFLITFTDSSNNFKNNFPMFKDIVKSIRFQQE